MVSSSRAFRAILAATLLLAAMPAAANPPRRVASINLCTDQLAMLVAAPGQLQSVSWMSRDPTHSAMAEEARSHAVNHGRAEELFLAKPDLVLAGTWTTRATVDLLRRLGFEVAEFAPVASFDDIRGNIRRMGRLLGRDARAEGLVAELDARLQAAAPAAGSPTPRAALREAGSITSGAGTLANAIMEAAGLGNVANELGLHGLARLPLETLVMAAPDMLVTSRRYEGRALAEASLDHPALRRVAGGVAGTATSDARWVCGGPFTAAAVTELAAARDRLIEGNAR